jgi:tRNA(Leu) C34 or U34 (ribose-2'-O)-methylase TrmL
VRGYAAIGLYSPCKAVNIGSVLRASMCYGVAMVGIEGARYARQASDTTAAFRHIPLLHGKLLEMIPYDCVPVVVELRDDARSLVDYQHPERAFYVFGPEDGDVPERIASKCRDRIYVPTRFCMNLAATANVILYDRMAKQKREAA